MNTTGISGNTIYLDNVTHTDAWYGIAVQSGSDNIISNNSISTGGTATSGLEKILYGISIESSETNTVSQNSLTNLGTGIRFFNSHVINTVSCNSLTGSYRQITMESSYIGDQGNSSEASDNIWVRGANTNANLAAIDTNSFSSTWWVRASSGSYFPGTGSGYMFPPFHYTIGISSPTSTCITPCNTPVCIQHRLKKIVNQTDEFYAMTEENEYSVQQYAFEILSNDTTLMHLNTENDSILQVFYQTLNNGNIHKLLQIENFLEEDNATEAESTNNNLTPEIIREENDQVFNDIYINTWEDNNFDLDSITQATLMDIATQNPISGGTSVYSARVMLNLDISDNFTEIQERVRNPKALTYANKVNAIGKIIPNPNSGLMEYHAKMFPKTKGLLEIYNLMGNLVKSLVLYPELKQLRIDLSNFPSGIYPYRIILDNINYEYDKIVLQK